tara:strand:+ start:320 stop:472 length:153 start_codon:yes stop_codon:yes gene_type:complete
LTHACLYSNEISASSQEIKGDPIDKPEYPSFIFSLTSDLTPTPPAAIIGI